MSNVEEVRRYLRDFGATVDVPALEGSGLELRIRRRGKHHELALFAEHTNLRRSNWVRADDVKVTVGA